MRSFVVQTIKWNKGSAENSSLSYLALQTMQPEALKTKKRHEVESGLPEKKTKKTLNDKEDSRGIAGKVVTAFAVFARGPGGVRRPAAERPYSPPALRKKSSRR